MNVRIRLFLILQTLKIQELLYCAVHLFEGVREHSACTRLTHTHPCHLIPRIILFKFLGSCFMYFSINQVKIGLYSLT